MGSSGLWAGVALSGVAVLGVGCVPRATVGRVEIVPTHTPGLAFVVVRPSVVRRRDALPAQGGVERSSEYILLCDGRPVDGMHCAIASEVAQQRLSYHPTNVAADAPVNHPVGSLEGTTIESSEVRAPGEVPPLPVPGATPAAGEEATP